MPKNSIADFDTVPDNNTDIGSIDVRGAAPVQNFDNAFRTLMAYLKASYNATSAFMRTVLDDADAAAARATLDVLQGREVYRSTSLVGVSALTIDIPDDLNFFEMEIFGLSSQSSTCGVYLRCGSAGAAADVGASDYYLNRADLATTSPSVVPANGYGSAVQLFSVVPDSQARATLRGDTGGASSRWSFSGDFRSSDNTSFLAGWVFGRRVSAPIRKPRLFISTDAPFGGGTIIVRGRP